MAYKVPDLRYAYDALEPHIDEQTMRLHHDRHHQACATKTADPTTSTRGSTRSTGRSWPSGTRRRRSSRERHERDGAT